MPEAVAAAADGGASTCAPASTRDSTLTKACRDSEQSGEKTHEPSRSRRRVGARWNRCRSLASRIPPVTPRGTNSRARCVEIMQMASTCVNNDDSQMHLRADFVLKRPVLVGNWSCLHRNICFAIFNSNAEEHQKWQGLVLFSHYI